MNSSTIRIASGVLGAAIMAALLGSAALAYANHRIDLLAWPYHSAGDICIGLYAFFAYFVVARMIRDGHRAGLLAFCGLASYGIALFLEGSPNIDGLAPDYLTHAFELSFYVLPIVLLAELVFTTIDFFEKPGPFTRRTVRG